MNLFVNTNKTRLSTDGREIFDHGIFATYADPDDPDPRAPEQIRMIGEGDQIFAYESGTGLVARGLALEHGTGDPAENLVVSPDEKTEWHVDVDWTDVFLDDPILASELRDIVGYPVYVSGTIVSLTQGVSALTQQI